MHLKPYIPLHYKSIIRRPDKTPKSILINRVVQATCLIVIQPVFEADFLDCSFGFRPKCKWSAHQAIKTITMNKGLQPSTTPP